MVRRLFSKGALGVAATAIAVTLGFSTPAHAQIPPDFTEITDCVAPLDPLIWFGFCSPVWKLPLGGPEIAFGNIGVIRYDSTSDVLTVTAQITSVYFNQHGNADLFQLPGGLPDGARMATTAWVLRIKVGADGKFIGGAGGACGAGTFDDLCVTGVVTDTNGVHYGTTNPLVRGRVEHFANKQNAIHHGFSDYPANTQPVLYDDFEYYVKVTGGDIFDNFWWANGYNHMIVEAFGFNCASPCQDNAGNQASPVNYVGGNPFGADFAELFTFGYGGVTLNDTGGLFDACNGQISGSVTDYFNPLSGVPGAEVQITNIGNVVPAANGSYSSPASLCVGPYTVTVHPPAGYVVYGGINDQIINVVADGVGNNTIAAGVNFKLYASAVNTTSFTTFAQAGWGAKPKNNNAGALLATYFDFLYPDTDNDGDTELVIGGHFTITESSPEAIQDFLPQEGRPWPLAANYVDPPSRFKVKHKGKYSHHRRLGSLAGETIALELNVRFSAFGLTRSGLGALHVASGKLQGWTVNQVLALANSALGGDALPAIFKAGIAGYDELEAIVERINKNFLAGAINNGYLIP